MQNIQLYCGCPFGILHRIGNNWELFASAAAAAGRAKRQRRDLISFVKLPGNRNSCKPLHTPPFWATPPDQVASLWASWPFGNGFGPNMRKPFNQSHSKGFLRPPTNLMEAKFTEISKHNTNIFMHFCAGSQENNLKVLI